MALSAPVLKKLAEKITPRRFLLPNRTQVFNRAKEEARKAELLVEVRDARIPFTSAHLPFQQILKWRPHIVVFTKSDLADKEKLADWKAYFKGENFIFVNTYSKSSVRRLMRLIKQKVMEIAPHEKKHLIMLLGMPNVGKTALINAMHHIGRQRVQMMDKLTLGVVGQRPFLTTQFFTSKIHYEPSIYATDSPSVMFCDVPDLETAYKLNLIGAIKDCLVGRVNLARYLLAVINTLQPGMHEMWKSEYDARKFLKDPAKEHNGRLIPKDDYYVEVKGLIATRVLQFKGDLQNLEQMERLVDAQFNDLLNFYNSVKIRTEVNEERAAKRLLSLYRVGRLGRFTWDPVPTMTTALYKPAADSILSPSTALTSIWAFNRKV